MAGRYAPSTSGLAHPGTLLAGLLAWLDARARGDRIVLRLENLDLERCKPGFSSAMEADLAWLGLDWDEVRHQDELRPQHERALDTLEANGRLYPCSCSRAERRASGRRGPDGGWAYDNRCRDRALPQGGWRNADAAVRLRLPDRAVTLRDEGGADLSQTPAYDLGDPIVVRRDHVVAYQLAVVVDDAADGVTRVIRGRDIATSTATQVLVHELLDLPLPVYRHHFLLLEPHGDKLAKLHGSIDAARLRASYDGPALCGVLARASGLRDDDRPCTPAELLGDFDWSRVRDADLIMEWDGEKLTTRPA